MEAWQWSATQALSQIRNGKLTVEDYTRSLLSRIEARDAQVKAWAYLDKELVLSRAKELDQVPFDKRGPIHGLPIGIKDIMLTKDLPTQYNSLLYEASTPINTDAAPVATLRQSGALIFGKLTTTEFATSKQGDWFQNRTRNAHSENHTPGGSSSGSGAATADFQIPIATGTQTGGSIVRPASFNGCYGWKPTWNAISREGLAQWSMTFDTCGFFARSVDDLELMADVFRLHKNQETTPLRMKGAKIAFCKTHNWPKAGNGTRSAMHTALMTLAQHGAEVADLELPQDFAKALDWHAVILASEGKSSFLSHYLTNAEQLHEDIRGYVQGEVSEQDILTAYDGLAALRPHWDLIASQYDVILTPSVPDEAPLGIDKTGDMSFCSMWTALHVPALNIPFHHGSSGLPIGLTLVGARLTDRAVLAKGKILGRILQQLDVENT
ncbi:hypothetical protein AMS68_006935 [Peltaster fructicola]|uniref:Amidase domain-containing protein n=1 Tax=Peltaster fructicola TaxID=286661 RepID=A0A6H0Y3J6_9PEZI|nr:hypothetical protein AMS68_006935 [Peltaster fructicola]